MRCCVILCNEHLTAMPGITDDVIHISSFWHSARRCDVRMATIVRCECCFFVILSLYDYAVFLFQTTCLCHLHGFCAGKGSFPRNVGNQCIQHFCTVSCAELQNAPRIYHVLKQQLYPNMSDDAFTGYTVKAWASLMVQYNVMLLFRLQHCSVESTLAEHPGCLPDTAGYPHTELCAPVLGRCLSLLPLCKLALHQLHLKCTVCFWPFVYLSTCFQLQDSLYLSKGIANLYIAPPGSPA